MALGPDSFSRISRQFSYAFIPENGQDYACLSDGFELPGSADEPA